MNWMMILKIASLIISALSGAGGLFQVGVASTRVSAGEFGGAGDIFAVSWPFVTSLVTLIGGLAIRRGGMPKEIAELVADGLAFFKDRTPANFRRFAFSVTDVFVAAIPEGDYPKTRAAAEALESALNEEIRLARSK